MTEFMTNTAGTKRLIIDLEKCDQCNSCGVSCDYYNRPHAQDNGMPGLRERATFALICRRCEQASCVEACPFNAIERQDDGIIKRYNLRCVSCKSCAQACPFGTIYADMLPFYETHCDACLGRNENTPPCVDSCSRGALEYRVPGENETDIHILDEHLAARAERWIKQEMTT
jgi:Fe-S-cluster-containing hydrogenase component 2